MQQVNTLVQYIRSKWDIFKLQQNLCRNGARFRAATFACKPMTLLVGRRAPEIAILVGREAPEIQPSDWTFPSSEGPRNGQLEGNVFDKK